MVGVNICVTKGLNKGVNIGVNKYINLNMIVYNTLGCLCVVKDLKQTIFQEKKGYGLTD